MWGKRKLGVVNDCKLFGVSNWKDGFAFFWKLGLGHIKV